MPLRAPYRVLLTAAGLATGAACHTPAEPPGPAATPIYSATTGRLEQVVSDGDGDGTIDTRAFMDGRKLQRIEIDRDNDGRVDRWEYYVEAPAGRVKPGAPLGRAEIERVEQADGPDGSVTRREFYEHGELARVEDDANLDGRVDRWEHFEHGVLSRLEVDMRGTGAADRRLLYRKDGSIDRIEVDPTGTGSWQEAPADPPAASR